MRYNRLLRILRAQIPLASTMPPTMAKENQTTATKTSNQETQNTPRLFFFVTSQMTQIRGWGDTFDQLTQAIPFAPKTTPQIPCI